MEEQFAVVTSKAPTPAGPLSQAIICGDFVFVSGQRPQIPGTDIIVEGIKEQTRQTIKNIEAILAECGCTLKNVVKSTVFLSDIGYYAEMNEVYKEMFSQPYPSRTACGVQLRNIDVEIEVVAKLPVKNQK